MIPYGRQQITRQDIEAVINVLQSDWLTQGPAITEFERALCELTGAKHCVVVVNGTVALHLACMAVGLGNNQVGLTSPISFLASANCMLYCGAIPDFVDIDAGTLCLSPEQVEHYCENHPIPTVVIPVDFAGVPADLPRLKKLADTYGFSLIEDAAHAIGSDYFYKGQRYACGGCAHTELAVFSFHPVKTITTGEGGAVLTNDDCLAETIRRLANHGIERDPSRFLLPNQAKDSEESCRSDSPAPSWYHEMHSIGYNGRMTDIQASLGLSQLKRLKDFKQKRQQIVSTYNKAFSGLDNSQIAFIPPWPSETDPCQHLYPLRLGPNCQRKRVDLINHLKKHKIYSQIHYIPIYRQPYYRKRFGYNEDRFPEAEKYFTSCLSLPLFAGLDDQMQQKVIDIVLEFFNGRSACGA